MNEREGELISALLDGELDESASQQAISVLLKAGQGQQDKFGRYRLIGDVMRGESVVPGGGLVEGVREALRDEPVVLAPPPRPPRRWLKPVTGAAIAASVAAVAVFVTPQLVSQQGKNDLGGPQLAAEVPRVQATPVAIGAAGATASLVAQRAQTEPQWQALDRELADRLNRLMIEHQEFGGRTGINGPVPHIGLVSYGTR